MKAPLTPAFDAEASEGLGAAPALERDAPADLGTRAGVERALSQLFPGVRSLLYRMLGPRADLDDATQEALIELASALPRFRGDSGLSTFARRITVRVGYRYFSRRAVHVELEPERHADHAKLPDEELAQRRALARLHRCLAKLPDKRRAAFVLCGIEGLAPEEAAALLGVSAGSMRSRFMHAREELKRLLSAQRLEDVDG